jgi:hypothetical protein
MNSELYINEQQVYKYQPYNISAVKDLGEYPICEGVGGIPHIIIYLHGALTGITNINPM